MSNRGRAHRSHGEGSITRRADGRYEIRLTLPNGERKSWYAADRRAAERRRAELLAELQAGRDLAEPSQTVAAYLDTWLQQRRRALAPATADSYAYNVELAKPAIGRLRLDQLRAAHLDALYAALLERGLSNSTVHQVHRTLRAALNRAIKQGILLRAPTVAATPPRLPPTPRRGPSREMVRRLIEESSTDPRHALWVLLATTGLRISEALGLTWEALDVERAQVTVSHTLEVRRGAPPHLKETTKTSGSRRTIALAPSLLPILAAHRDRQRLAAKQAAAAGVAEWNALNLIFCHDRPGENGSPLTQSGVWHELQKCCERLGLPRFSPHALRHAAVTYLVANGVHPAIVQAIAGHTSGKMMENYTHLMPAHQAPAVSVLEELFPASAPANETTA